MQHHHHRHHRQPTQQHARLQTRACAHEHTAVKRAGGFGRSARTLSCASPHNKFILTLLIKLNDARRSDGDVVGRQTPRQRARTHKPQNKCAATPQHTQTGTLALIKIITALTRVAAHFAGAFNVQLLSTSGILFKNNALQPPHSSSLSR